MAQQPSVSQAKNLSDLMARQLDAQGCAYFVQNFALNAPAELERTFAHVPTAQRELILQEASQLFQRPLSDPFIQQQLTAAHLPVDRILADYQQRQVKLGQMGQAEADKAMRVVKYGATMTVASVAGGIATMIGASFLFKHVPALRSNLRRYAVSLLTGFGATMGIALGARMAVPQLPEVMQSGLPNAIEREMITDAAFVGEILNMAALSYAKTRAAEVIQEPDTHAGKNAGWVKRVEENAALHEAGRTR